MLVVASPGQGAQKPGFLTPWLEIDSVTELAATLSEACGIDVIAHGTTSDAYTIRDTAVAQPLLVASSLIAHSVLFGALDVPRADFYTGHSVGEIGAASQAGVLTQSDAMEFVRDRSQAMARAAALEDTGMVAIVGGTREDVLEAIATSGATAANINGAAQVVAAGSRAQLDSLASNPPAKARVIPLQVAGAFHSPFMEGAREELRETIGNYSVREAQIPLITNARGEVVTDGHVVLESLVSQVAHTVDWLSCMRTCEERGVTGLLELAPAGTLTGLAKRDAKSIARFDLNTPDQLDDARAFIREHAGTKLEEA